MKGHNIANLIDINKNSDIEVEINKHNKNQNFVGLRMKRKTDNEIYWISADVEIKELYSLVLMLVSGEQQESLIPDRQIDVKVYERQHKIKLLKDMKKGEIVVANFKVEVPTNIKDDLKTFIGKDYKVQIKEIKDNKQ